MASFKPSAHSYGAADMPLVQRLGIDDLTKKTRAARQLGSDVVEGEGASWKPFVLSAAVAFSAGLGVLWWRRRRAA